MADSPILNEAIRLWREGWKVLPIQPGPEKRPLWKYRNYQRPSEARVRATWGGANPPDLGVVLPDGMAVIDPDSPAYLDVAEQLLSTTKCAWTILKEREGQERRGLHAWFKVKEPLPGNRKSWYPVPHGLDVKGPGSVVIVPPSRGREWANDLEAQEVDSIQPLVKSMVAEVGEPLRERMASDLLVPGVALTEGERNRGLISLAGVLRKSGFAGDRLLAALRGLNDAICDPPMAPDEVGAITESAAAYVPSPFESDAYDLELLTGGEHVPPVGFNVDDFWPSEGVTYIYGREGLGKTYIGMTVAAAILAARDWLGLAVPRRGPLIYVDFERRGKAFKRRWTAIARGMGLKELPPIVYLTPNRALPSIMDDLAGVCLAQGAVGLILDSLTISLVGIDVIKEYDKVIAALMQLNRFPVPLLVFDHRRKPQPGEQANLATGGFGTVFKQVIPSMVWQLWKGHDGFLEGGFDFSLKHEKNNFDLDPPILHGHFELETAQKSIQAVRLVRQQRESAITQVAELVSAVPNADGWTLADLANSTGQDPKAIEKATETLVRVGKLFVIRKRGRGNANRYFEAEEA